ncbi:unnamed protein product [Cylindrotheca closterium]|uniref:Uncharacterized protein n=1 Tax=Cylindrotheca closterium TaxID=2856 RepID=A0AAD2CU29_9STRA|nr:unnamed protein product [Cylindrotheca closterium]
MTVTIKKAGEAVAKQVIQSGSKAAAAKGSPSIKLTEPRAVTKEEAQNVVPSKESVKTTMMPWRGWVDRVMKDKLSEKTYKGIRDFAYFMPDGPYDVMEQMPSPATKVPISQDGEAASFREVSPGSQGFVDIPKFDLDDDPYDSAYFKTDTRRRYIDPENPHPEIEDLKLAMQDPNDPEVQDAKAKLAAGPGSSKGNGGNFPTGPSDFDPSGLRAVMSVTQAAIDEELDKHMPDHLPESVWTAKDEELIKWYKDNDLPVPIGGNWNYISKHRRVARW